MDGGASWCESAIEWADISQVSDPVQQEDIHGYEAPQNPGMPAWWNTTMVMARAGERRLCPQAGLLGEQVGT
jgi:hypothetical protein